MKIHYFLLGISLFLAESAFGQFGTQNVISTSQSQPFGLQPIDLDNDGDLDLIVSSEGDDRIIWYENLDGAGSYGSENVITTLADGPRTIHLADLDGDDDLDLLSASSNDNKVAWYENLDGLGTFGEQTVISTIGSGVLFVYTGDLDNDGDQDILSASHSDNTLRWHENLDGLGNFGPINVISDHAGDPYFIKAADLDNDGFLDVYFTGLNGSKVGWHRNIDGTGNFGPEQLLTLNMGSGLAVDAIDIDGDSYLDIVAGSGYDGKLGWFRNTDGMGVFSAQSIISDTCAGVIILDTKDMDNDSDIDVLATCLWNNKISWFENLNGEGVFSEEQIISEETMGASSIAGADINNDGKLDVISLSYIDNKIAWYENEMVLGLTDNELSEFYIYPNPTHSILHINSSLDTYEIEIYSGVGQLIQKSNNENEVDVSMLSSGIYLVRLIGANENSSIQKFVKI